MVNVPPATDIYPNRPIAFHNLLPKEGVGVELGVARGENSESLFVATNPTKMFLVDVWDNETALGPDGDPFFPKLGVFKNHFESVDKSYHTHVLQYFKPYINQNRIVVRKQGASEFLEAMPDDTFDWVFIDTSHHYRETFITLEASIRKTKVGGVIGMHDFAINMHLWDTVSPICHFIYERKIKAIGQCGKASSPTLFVKRVE